MDIFRCNRIGALTDAPLDRTPAVLPNEIIAQLAKAHNYNVRVLATSFLLDRAVASRDSLLTIAQGTRTLSTPQERLTSATILLHLAKSEPHQRRLLQLGVLKPLARLIVSRPASTTSSTLANFLHTTRANETRSAETLAQRYAMTAIVKLLLSDKSNEKWRQKLVMDYNILPALRQHLLAHPTCVTETKNQGILLLHQLCLCESLHSAIMQAGFLDILARHLRSSFGNAGAQRIITHALVRLVYSGEDDERFGPNPIDQLGDMNITFLMVSNLNHDDFELVSWSVFILHEFLTHNIDVERIIAVRGIGKRLVEIIGGKEQRNPVIIKVILRIIKFVTSASDRVLLDCIGAGVVSEAVKGLCSDDVEIQYWSLSLLNRLLKRENAVDDFITNDGLDALISHFGDCPEHHVLYVADIIASICNYPSSHSALAKSNVLFVVLKLSRSADTAILEAGAILLLKLICISSEIINLVLENAGIEILALMLLKYEMPLVQISAAKALSILAMECGLPASKVVYQMALEPLIMKIIIQNSLVNSITTPISPITTGDPGGVVFDKLTKINERTVSLRRIKGYISALYYFIERDPRKPLHAELLESRLKGTYRPLCNALLDFMALPLASRISEFQTIAEECVDDGIVLTSPALIASRRLLKMQASPNSDSASSASSAPSSPISTQSSGQEEKSDNNCSESVQEELKLQQSPEKRPRSPFVESSFNLTFNTAKAKAHNESLVVMIEQQEDVSILAMRCIQAFCDFIEPLKLFGEEQLESMLIAIARRRIGYMSAQAAETLSIWQIKGHVSQKALQAAAFGFTTHFEYLTNDQATERSKFYSRCALEHICDPGLAMDLSYYGMDTHNRTPAACISPSRNEIWNPSGGLETILAVDGVEAGKFAYEVCLLTDGVIQIGIASEDATFNSKTGVGVGDEQNSYAFDGQRMKKWHGGSVAYGSERWKQHDIVTVLMDLECSSLSFLINGMSLGIAFNELPTDVKWFPALSLSSDQGCRVSFGGLIDPLNYLPTGYRGIGEYFASTKNAPILARGRAPSWIQSGQKDQRPRSIPPPPLLHNRLGLHNHPTFPLPDHLYFYYEARVVLKGSEIPIFGCVDRESNLIFIAFCGGSAYLMTSLGQPTMVYNRGFEERLFEYLDEAQSNGRMPSSEGYFESQVKVQTVLASFNLQDGDVLGCGLSKDQAIFTYNGLPVGKPI